MLPGFVTYEYNVQKHLSAVCLKSSKCAQKTKKKWFNIDFPTKKKIFFIKNKLALNIFFGFSGDY